MISYERTITPVDRMKQGVGATLAALTLAACGASAEAKHDPPGLVPAAENSISEVFSYTVLLEAQWRDIIESRQGQVDVALIDFKTGQTAEYGNAPGEQFYTASIAKLSILVELLRQYQAQNIPVWQCDTPEMQAAMACEQLDLAHPMITVSDNTTANQLFAAAGGAEAIRGLYRDIGATSTTIGEDWGVIQTTAADQVKLVSVVAQPSTLLRPEYAQVASDMMSEVVDWQQWGVSAGATLPSEYRLKNGWIPNLNTTINSIGFVRDTEGMPRYALAVMTKGAPSMDYAVETIEQVSAAAYTAAS